MSSIYFVFPIAKDKDPEAMFHAVSSKIPNKDIRYVMQLMRRDPSMATKIRKWHSKYLKNKGMYPWCVLTYIYLSFFLEFWHCCCIVFTYLQICTFSTDKVIQLSYAECLAMIIQEKMPKESYQRIRNKSLLCNANIYR